jgi:choline dehydrogenase-like flavoprotein
MTEKSYDVVIVGAGVAGAVLAKVLSGSGKSVLLLEAGAQAGIELEAVEAYANYQSYLDRFYTAVAKVPNAPYPNLSNAPSPDVINLGAFDTKKPVVENDDWPKRDDSKLRLTQGYFVQKGALPFGSDYQRAPGGTMLHWLGTTLRMVPNDFKERTTYGHGADWPITYDDLKPYYEMAEREIGVSGAVEEQDIPGCGPDYFAPGYEYPMRKIPQSYLDGQFVENVKGRTIKVNGQAYQLNVISTPQGRNSTPNADYKLSEARWDAKRKKLKLEPTEQSYQPVGSVWDPHTGQRCEGNASCVPICPVQAKYNPLKTIKSAVDKLQELSAHTRGGGRVGSIDIITQAVASKIEYEPDGRIKGITYKQYRNPERTDYVEKSARGTIYALAAHSVENAKLLLASDACRNSEHVGRNLMDHTCGLSWGLTPEPCGSYRGPGSTSNIPSFRDGAFRSQHGPFIMPIDNWGWSWPVFSPGSDFTNAMNGQGGVPKPLFGKELRRHLEGTLRRQFNVHFECEQMPEYTNRVTIHPRFTDALGNYRPVITYNLSDYSRAAFVAGRQVAKEVFKLLKVEDKTYFSPNDPSYFTAAVDGKEEGFITYGAGHLCGTHRMGFSPSDSVVNSRQQAWDHRNLYLVGCGSMVTIGTSNPSLTMTAMAFWAAENILKDLS